MGDSEVIERLVAFGLTRQEATIYLCLLQKGEITGYEAAKQTGISRSNVYNALAGLTEKGAAYICEGAASKYVPVTVEEFCDNKLRELGACKEYLQKHVKQQEEQTDGYITIQGAKHINDKIFQCLAHAKYRVYLYAPSHFIERWREELLALINRGIKVVLMSEQEIDIPGGIVYQAVDPMKHQLRLIIDSKAVLTGQITDSSEDSCLYSGQENFVEVFKDALRNEIKLIELTQKK